MNMGDEKGELKLDRKTSPFRPDGRTDFGPGETFTPEELEKIALRKHNMRVTQGVGLYDQDHPGC